MKECGWVEEDYHGVKGVGEGRCRMEGSVCAAPKDGASFLQMIQQTELLSSPRDIVCMYRAHHNLLSEHANEILEGALIR